MATTENQAKIWIWSQHQFSTIPIEMHKLDSYMTSNSTQQIDEFTWTFPNNMRMRTVHIANMRSAAYNMEIL